jgi:guanylate kinase
MSRIKVRDGDGVEYSFSTREEFAHAVEQGGVTADWQIFHSTTERWLPVNVHPVYQTAMVRSRKVVGQDLG